jgi:hypothetical protein
MSSSPSLLSSDSEPSDTLSYASRTDYGAGFMSTASLSPAPGSLDFGRRTQVPEAGLGLRPLDTGAMFSSGHMVCLPGLAWALICIFPRISAKPNLEHISLRPCMTSPHRTPAKNVRVYGTRRTNFTVSYLC